MHLRTLSFSLAAVTAGLYLSSYSSGPASNDVDATSSGLGSRKCASCHSGGDYGTSTAVTLLDADGVAVTAYRPGEDYTLRINIATSTAPRGYGFQVLAIDEADGQAGTFSNASADARLSELGGRTYFEHRRRSNSPRHEVTWTAPEAGAGTVTVYGVGNAVNGIGTGGDDPDEAIVTFTESGASSVGEDAWPGGVRTFAPGAGVIRVVPDGTVTGDYHVDVVALDGRAVGARRVLAEAPLTQSGLAPGIYVVRLTRGDGAAVTRMVPVLR